MRKLGLTLLVGAMTVAPAAALSQEQVQGAAPSVDDYVCALSGDCGEEDAAPTEEATPDAGRPRISATRGFALSRPSTESTERATETRDRASTTPRATPRQSASRPDQRQASSSSSSTPRRVDLRVAFALGSAALTDAGLAQARAFAEALKRPQLANARVRIEGHTDSSGGRALNVALSQKRAEAVADFLVSQGIERSRLEVRGYGYDRPLPGRSAASSDNRRVEAVRIS